MGHVSAGIRQYQCRIAGIFAVCINPVSYHQGAVTHRFNSPYVPGALDGRLWHAGYKIGVQSDACELSCILLRDKDRVSNPQSLTQGG